MSQSKRMSMVESWANVLFCKKCNKKFTVKPYRLSIAKFCSRSCSGEAPIQDRFWAKVDKKSDNECWLWTSSVGSTGYGQISFKGKPRKAHRIAYQLTYGNIPIGLGVLHHCDIPKCCNPKHLFTGTQKDNLADMVSKGRHVKANPMRGESSPNSKLTIKAVRIIRSSNEPHTVLAKQFGVSDTAVIHVRKGRNWKYTL